MLTFLSTIPWWAASLLANACIMGVEYFNHAGGFGSWGQTLIRTAPLIIVAQWGLYHSFSGATHWLMAWAFFSIGNAIMRVAAVTLLQGNQIGSLAHVMIGVAVMILGSLVLKEGLS